MRSLFSPIPLFFVFLWSTGFIVARYGLPYAPPLTFLLLRFLGVLAILAPAVLLLRAPWPKGKVGHVAFAGLLLQAGYLSGVWCAIKLGMPAGLSALIVGMQPILTAFAAPLIGERVRPRQWLGLVFGLGGVALVVYAKITLVGLSWQAIALAVFALLSITAGTLYQKHYCPQFDLRTGTVIQFAASFVVVCLAAGRHGLDPVDPAILRRLGLVCARLVHRRDFPSVCADPSQQRDPGHKPALPHAANHGDHGLGHVWRSPELDGHCRYGAGSDWSNICS
jgi:drug/metabolite transporter (DMT)-like permease